MTFISSSKLQNGIDHAYLIATDNGALRTIWGMTLVERLLRQLSQIGISRATVICDASFDVGDVLRPDFSQWNDIRVEISVPEREASASLVPVFPGRALIVDARIVVDSRILEHLKNTSEDTRFDVENRFVGATTYAGYEDPAIARIRDTDVNAYIKTTRKHVTAFAIPVDSGHDVEFAENTTFAAAYKGATDFITKYVFYLPARWAVRKVSPTGITPNQVTMTSMVISFGAVVPFFTGHYWVATIMGFAMAFLDTVDGKLARVTLRTSKSGDLLDHVSDFVYLLLWYVGLGWSLTGGHLFDFSREAALYHAVLIGAFLADKIITGLYKRIYGYELHDYTRLDYTVRIFIARRNPFLICMLIALILGDPMIGLLMITAWYVLTLIFHLMRFVYLPISGEKHQYESS
ncbi:CDP-alcohol phosphatidyltransferase family protein [Pseudomonadota bacterium]